MLKKLPSTLLKALKLARRWLLYFSKSAQKRRLLSYFYYLFLHPLAAFPAANSLFKLSHFPALRRFLFSALFWDFDFYKRLAEPETLGLRLWEYGVLLKNTDLQDKKILDIGVGTSLLPFYLAEKKNASVTALDLPQPMESPYLERVEDTSGVDYQSGSVTNLPFEDESFDAVVAISTLEHLDANYDKMAPISYLQFIKRTKKALTEIIRVCRSGGLIYLTTDFYLPGQKTDRWSSQVKYKNRLGGVYQAKDLSLFTSLLKAPSLDLNLLSSSARYANYRGRYITTTNFLYRKP